MLPVQTAIANWNWFLHAGSATKSTLWYRLQRRIYPKVSAPQGLALNMPSPANNIFDQNPAGPEHV